MRKELQSTVASRKDVSEVMGDLWDIEERLKAFAILFRNFDGGGSEIQDAEHLKGAGYMLSDLAKGLADIISNQLDGREFEKEG